MTTQATPDNRPSPRQWALKLLEKGGFSPLNADNYAWAVDYLTEWTGGHTSLGAAIFGPVGTGKTHFLRVLEGRYGRIRTASDWARLLRDDAETFWSECTATPSWDFQRYCLLDDVGAEPVVNSYGNKSCVVTELVQARYAAWARDGRLKLFLTTNLDAAEFRARYGERVVSRLKACCQVAVFVGADLRQAASSAPAAEPPKPWYATED